MRIAYPIDHWTPLTLFYKTSNGAHVGDLFMSLIHACKLEGANPFEYLTELQRHADALVANPGSGQ